MPHYEYKVIPAPARGKKARNARTVETRFAYAIQDTMNRMAALGWEFQRAEMLPSEERQGLTSTRTVYRNVLVFRRLRPDDASDFKPVLLEDLSAGEDTDDSDDIAAGSVAPNANGKDVETDKPVSLPDNGVEDTEQVNSSLPVALLARVRGIGKKTET